MAFQQGVFDLLARRPRETTVCLSEVAQTLGKNDWRDLIATTRHAAWRLEAERHVVVLQGGRRVSRAHARGLTRIGLSQEPGSGVAGRGRLAP